MSKNEDGIISKKAMWGICEFSYQEEIYQGRNHQG